MKFYHIAIFLLKNGNIEVIGISAKKNLLRISKEKQDEVAYQIFIGEHFKEKDILYSEFKELQIVETFFARRVFHDLQEARLYKKFVEKQISFQQN